MVEAEGDAGIPLRQRTGVPETVGLGIEAAHELVLLEQRVAPLPARIGQILALAEVTDAAHARKLHVPLDLLLDVRLRQPRLGHDPVGEAGPVCHLLQPARLLDGVGRAQRRLHVHGFGDVLEPGLRRCTRPRRSAAA